jgi:hypothetical protein
MNPLGMRILIERDIDREFTFTVPEWIGQHLGEFLLMEYDGQKLTIWPVEPEPCCIAIESD